MRYSLGIVFFNGEFLGISLIFVVYIWIVKGVFNYRSVKYDKDNFYVRDLLHIRKDIIPLESIESIKYTYLHSGLIFEYKIKYKKLEKNKYFYTFVRVSNSFGTLVIFLEDKNPSIAEMLKSNNVTLK
ncbi:MAG: hypothetical protein KIT80_10645 [Chitinophagaceae bacterium]|nr:hypothetical protein [Chitinophagaceae bacterium]MCW5927360.1 hypothetical protein [Chitinophagaceae bacterium]